MGNKKRVLALAFCREGPYKHALGLLRNAQVEWIPWSYHESQIASDVLKDLRRGMALDGWEVLFVYGSLDFRGDAQFVRRGTIDHWSLSYDTLRLTVFLGEALDGHLELPPSRSLCFYLP